MANEARAQQARCNLCGNRCGANRSRDVTVCGAGMHMEVSYSGIHHGEEPPISGRTGCGNFFFHHCGMSCVFCQNWQISNEDAVEPVVMTADRLTWEMLRFQEAGVATIGLVSPTSHVPIIAPALYQAKTAGLSVPVVYNTNGFDTLEALALVDGLVDVYLPDMKYASDEPARILSGVTNYVHTNRAAVEAMLAQVGPTVIGAGGVIRSGLVVRHLVLPGGHSDTVEVLQWIARNLPRSVYVSLMAQYTPSYQVRSGFFPDLDTRLSQQEYDFFIEIADELGLENVFIQDLSSPDHYSPDFSAARPFKE